MIIPMEELSSDVLYSLVESFVLREGTEYGEQDVPTDQKVQQVIMQLKSKEALILYSELHETINIITQDQFKQLSENEQQE